jgi:hypothetical protein
MPVPTTQLLDLSRITPAYFVAIVIMDSLQTARRVNLTFALLGAS